MKSITLNSGAVMPTVGLGVFLISDATVCELTVQTALRVGCRLIDTAAAYGNAASRGPRRRGIRSAARRATPLTTKIWVTDHYTPRPRR